jgi:hypothetical protein
VRDARLVVGAIAQALGAHVLRPAGVWRDLASLRGAAGLDDPAFRSRRGGDLDPLAIFHIVRRAAERTELEQGTKVSPRWLRHAHATHALEARCAVHLVQAMPGLCLTRHDRPLLACTTARQLGALYVELSAVAAADDSTSARRRAGPPTRSSRS